MRQRWSVKMAKCLPALDLADLMAETDDLNSSKRQFAPEYSQRAYITMRHSEFAVGNYVEVN